MRVACQNGQEDVARDLIERDIEIEQRDRAGNTPLIVAASYNSVDVVELLLEQGALIEVTNNSGLSVLAKASLKGCATDVAELFIGKFGKQGQLGSVVVGPIIKKGAQAQIQSSTSSTALVIACQYGDLHTPQALVHGGECVNAQDDKGCSPLHYAALRGKTGIVGMLLDNSASIDVSAKSGWIALMNASYNGHSEIVSMIAERGRNVNLQCPNGLTALSIACRFGHLITAHQLIHSRSSVDMDDQHGNSPLMCASNNAHVPIIQLLVEHGANIDLASKSGWNALMKATERGHVHVVKLLLQKGANIDKQGPKGATALNIACEQNQLDVVVLLSPREPHLNWRTTRGILH
ncbi:unnamed protein product [Phytophthora lilii]|uniref:Unnamed protein product n=1 Tax=Phytophthora lilii TaxID=2077276 RepID=A0A9W6U277_9STRA|nr:unnamed protein product [Phytophthora lilii]